MAAVVGSSGPRGSAGPFGTPDAHGSSRAAGIRRAPRRLFLTEAGAAAWREIHEGFAHLRLGAETLRNHRRGGSVVVNVSPAFATRWLLPRLPGFAAAQPAVSLRIATGLGPVDFDRSDADLAIRYGGGMHDGVDSRDLFGDCLAPRRTAVAIYEGERMGRAL